MHRERLDLVSSGAVGRPRVSLSVSNDPFLTVGVHLGAHSAGIAGSDLLGRTPDAVETPTPLGTAESAPASPAESAHRYLSRWRKQRTLWFGVSIGGSGDAGTGYVDHRRLGWAQAPVGPVFADELGLPVSVASRSNDSTRLYVYASETVGYAVVIDGRVHSPAGGPGTIPGLPVSSGPIPRVGG